MYAPELIEIPQTRNTIQQFKGYNHNIRIGEDEFYDMKNMSSKHFPTLSPREKRSVIKKIPECKGVFVGDKLAYVSDHTLYYGDKAMLELDTSIDSERNLVSMGAYLVIFPDMMYFNTADENDKGNIYDAPQIFEDTYKLTLLTGAGKEVSASEILYETGLEGNPFWSHKNSAEGIVNNQTYIKEDIFIDPFYNCSSRENAIYLYGIPSQPWRSEFTPDNEYRVEYNASYEQNAWGVIDGEAFFKTGQEDGVFVLSAKSKFYDTLEADLLKAYGNDSYVNKTSQPIFGTITVTRKLYDKNGDIIDTLERQYSVKALATTRFDPAAPNGYYIDTKGAYAPIAVGDVRLIHKDGVSCLEQCVKILEDDKNLDNVYVRTWKEPTCWTQIESFVKVSSNSDLRIGEKLQAILDNNSTEILNINSDNNKIYTKSLLNKYSKDNVSLLRSFAKYDSASSIIVNGCLDNRIDNLTEIPLEIRYENVYKKLDYVVECANRLWGCRYGKNNKGEFVNEIYATKQGSFKNWDIFDGTAQDSYAVSLGAGGRFTGAVNYNGRPMFFKENSIHTVYGSYPASYTLSTDTGGGLQYGSHKSLALMGQLLFYKALDGVYVYDGAASQKISDVLGQDTYSDAIGGATGQKYYVSMVNGEGERNLYVYDRTLGVWHKEDSVNVDFFARASNDLYLYNDDDQTLYSIKEQESLEKESEDIEWFCETGIIGFSTPEAKRISKMQIRLSLPVGSYVGFYVQYDSDGYWEYIGGLEGTSLRAFSIPFMPRKCDHFKLKISGKGECKIFSISKVLEEGGELV